MGWFELAIIYLAFGAPVAVHRATSVRGTFSARDTLDVGLSFVGWPVALIVFAWQRSSSSEIRQDERLRARINELAAELQTDIPPGEAADLPAALGLYVDLSIALNHPTEPTEKLFELSGHPDAALAARCSARRDSKKLAFHQLRARNDLISMIDRLADASTDRGATLRTSLAIVELLGDVDAAADLAAMDATRRPASRERTRSAAIATRR